MAERNYRPKRTARPENVKGTIWRLLRFMSPFKVHLIIVVLAVIVCTVLGILIGGLLQLSVPHDHEQGSHGRPCQHEA